MKKVLMAVALVATMFAAQNANGQTWKKRLLKWVASFSWLWQYDIQNGVADIVQDDMQVIIKTAESIFLYVCV
jgi:hypothetical protein